MMNQANWCLDACCHRASLGSILLHYDLDPVLILGPSLFTSAVLDSGYLRFGKNFLSNMVNLCARRGLAVEMRPARPSDSWEWARNYLRQGVPLAAVVDAYYLPYFYRDYRVFHHPHMIIVSSYDPATDVLHVIDADNTTRFSGSLSRKQFMDALESRWPLLLQRSQYLGTWVRVEPFSSYETPSRLKLVREVYQAARNLMHDSEELSPASIAHFMLQQIDDYLAISAATPHKRTFETWKHGSSFHRGLRFTSHALRWLAKSIQRVSISFGTSELRSFSTEIAEMAIEDIVADLDQALHAAKAMEPALSSTEKR